MSNQQQEAHEEYEDDVIYYKTDDEIAALKVSNEIVSKALAEVAKIIKPGMTGKQIDKVAEEYIYDQKAVPAFKNYKGFPATLCVSCNEMVVHGIPNDVVFKDGDIVSVDCGVQFEGFFGDSAYTFALGNVSEPTMDLLSTTLTSLYKGIEQAVHGKRLEDIGFAIQEYCERKHKYTVVRQLVGHGIGRSLHEAPVVQNFGRRGNGMVLREGLVIAIEPMINMGKKEVVTAEDGWTIRTIDRMPSAHYEHSIAVRKGKAEILSTHSYIEAAIKNNPELKEIFKKI